MKFPPSELADRYLTGLTGIEIGGAAQNPFGLDTWNVDRWAPGTSVREMYDREQQRICGEAMPIDVVSVGDRLPFGDDSLDFVVSSHVIEHFYDPVAALHEWARVARRYLFIICPQRDALEFDAVRPLTGLREIKRRRGEQHVDQPVNDMHHSRWTSETFTRMCAEFGYAVVDTEDPDTKAGNGFSVVIDLDVPSWRVRAATRRRQVREAPRILAHIARTRGRTLRV